MRQPITDAIRDIILISEIGKSGAANYTSDRTGG